MEINESEQLKYDVYKHIYEEFTGTIKELAEFLKVKECRVNNAIRWLFKNQLIIYAYGNVIPKEELRYINMIFHVPEGKVVTWDILQSKIGEILEKSKLRQKNRTKYKNKTRNTYNKIKRKLNFHVENILNSILNESFNLDEISNSFGMKRKTKANEKQSIEEVKYKAFPPQYYAIIKLDGTGKILFFIPKQEVNSIDESNIAYEKLKKEVSELENNLKQSLKDKGIHYQLKLFLQKQYSFKGKFLTREEQIQELQEGIYRVYKIRKQIDHSIEVGQDKKAFETKVRTEKIKLTKPKTDPANKKPGVIAVIRSYFEKGGTKDNCLKELLKQFPERPEMSMKTTINVQLGFHLPKKYKVIKTGKDKENIKIELL